MTGVLGSANATTTISGQQLPPPDPKFGGVIKQRASESKAWWPPRVVPPKKAPNVLLIMSDDDGFGSPSTFGGVIPTPALDRIAKSGLRYTNLPFRFALLANAGSTHHWTQPSFRRLRGGGRNRHRLPWVRLDHSD